MGSTCSNANTTQTAEIGIDPMPQPPKEKPFGKYIFQYHRVDRRRPANPADLKKPYCCIGFLTFIQAGKAEDTMTIATGTLILDNLVLTAAHPFFCRDAFNKKVNKCIPTSFRFQLNGEFQQESNYEIEDYRICPMFSTLMQHCQDDHYFQVQEKKMSTDLIGYDYALIKLKKSVTNVTFPKILKDFREISLTGSTSLLYGYAAEHIIFDKQNILGGAKIMGQKGEIIKIFTNYIQYDVDTSKGQSGSPVFVWTDKNMGKIQHFYLLGVHSGCFENYDSKFGAFVCQPMLENIKKWQVEMLKQGEEGNSFNICVFNNRLIVDVETYQPKIKPKHKPEPIIVVKPVALPRKILQEYRPFKFNFDMRTNQSDYYTVSKDSANKIVKRKSNQKYFQNKPYHLASCEPIISGKWKISLKLISASSDQVIVIGFMNSHRKIQTDMSGFIDQKQCVSLCLCDKMVDEEQQERRKQKILKKREDSILKKKVEQKNKDSSIHKGGQESRLETQKSPQQQKQITYKAFMLVDGVIQQQNKNIFLKNGDILTIYVNIQQMKLFWSFPQDQIFQCPIPESIFEEEGQMLFFVGLNNTKEVIQIIQTDRSSIKLSSTS